MIFYTKSSIIQTLTEAQTKKNLIAIKIAEKARAARKETRRVLQSEEVLYAKHALQMQENRERLKTKKKKRAIVRAQQTKLNREKKTRQFFLKKVKSVREK